MHRSGDDPGLRYALALGVIIALVVICIALALIFPGQTANFFDSIVR